MNHQRETEEKGDAVGYLDPETCLARIQLKHNLKSKLGLNTRYRLSFSLCSEFQDDLENVDMERFHFHLEPRSNSKPVTSFEYGPVTIQSKNLATIEFSVSLCGFYQLMLKGRKQHNEEKVILIPFLSDTFEIVEGIKAESSARFLTNYRVFNREIFDLQSIHPDSIYIKEEYGKTIGSHIYDSAIVLCSHLSDELGLPTIDRSRSIVELGAGLGLVSIYLEKYYHYYVISTDQKEQIPLLENNFRRNDTLSNSSILEFDWNHSEQLKTLCHRLLDPFLPSIEYILAADVWYETSMIPKFFSVLFELFETITRHHEDFPSSHPPKKVVQPPRLLVAQKNRKQLSVEEMQDFLFDQLPDFHRHLQHHPHHDHSISLELRCLFQMSQVMVWEIIFRLPNSSK